MPDDSFKDVPIENESAWLLVEKIAFDMVYRCGHPRGGCSSHCDRLVKIIELARERLKAERHYRAATITEITRHDAETFWREWSWNCATVSIAVTDAIKKLVLDFAVAYANRARAATKAETCPTCNAPYLPVGHIPGEPPDLCERLQGHSGGHSPAPAPQTEGKQVDSSTRYDDLDIGYRQTHNK